MTLSTKPSSKTEDPDSPFGQRPLIVTMIGEPAGVGPEVCVKALATGEPQAVARHLLMGNIAAVENAIQISRVGLKARAIDALSEAKFEAGTIDVLDDGALTAADYTEGQASLAAGRAVSGWMCEGQRLLEMKSIAGFIVAPIDRTSLKMATGLRDDVDIGPAGSYLFRVNGNLRVVPLSENTPISQVPATVTRSKIHEVMGLLHDTLRDWGFEQPRIAVAGLNPHSRGVEEENVIKPAIAEATAAGKRVTGPVSPDAVFRQCIEGKHDAVLSMYHDQGQIALKTRNFEGACSIYLGVPYLYVTVPHGSALDIAGKGVAQHLSMLSAMRSAGLLAAGRYARQVQGMRSDSVGERA